jgi:Fe-Mn family superoxide dismutase
MDVFEHAYMIDYDLDRAAYIDAFIKAVDWQVVAARFQ